MLKRSKKVLLIVLGVLLISGCKAKSEASMIINEDKTMTLKVIAGYDDELINAMMSMNDSSSLEEVDETTEYTDEEQRKFLKKTFDEDESFKNVESEGFIVDEYQDDTYMGYSITKNVENIDDLVGNNSNFSLSNLTDFESKKIFTKDGDVYKGKILFEDNTDMEDAETYGIDFDYVFTLTLPNKVILSNATTVSEDGKTLTWNLANNSVDAIEFQFEFPSFLTMIKDNMFIAAGIAVAVVIIIVIIVTLIIIKSKKGKKSNMNNVENEKIANKNMQSDVQPVMPKDPVVSIEPEVQPVMSQDPVASTEPEVQPVMPKDPVASTEPEVQPVMSQDPVVSIEPEVQPVMSQDPVVSIEPEVQPVMSQDPVVNIEPEVQSVMPQDPVVSVQLDVKPIPQDPVVITEIQPQPINNGQNDFSQPLFPQDIVPPKN